MICVVIKGPTLEEACQQIEQARPFAAIVELRLDCFTSFDIASIQQIRCRFSLPMIFTVRSVLQGGQFLQSEGERLSLIRQLAALNPEYIDLEHHVPLSFVHEIASSHPEIKLIFSYHDCTKTPEDLDAIYQELKQKPASFYKMAFMATSSVDALRFLSWVKQIDENIIISSMGPHGIISRILGSVVGSPITYATLKDEVGYLSAKTLVERYRVPLLNRQTALYGLVGDPVEHSMSDVTHNAYFKKKNWNAVYVKIQVKPTELEQVLSFAKQLPFHGLSVTMPLKEVILPYIDQLSPEASLIGATNTLLFQKGKSIGFNTDGRGALNVIEKEGSVRGKRIVLIGAGGAAKAIAYEAHRRGGLVTIVARDKEKVRPFAEKFSGSLYGLDEMADCFHAGYDILINCTPHSMPISSEYILPRTLVMDIKTKPHELPFLTSALEKGCRILHGKAMFLEQAEGQYALWFPA